VLLPRHRRRCTQRPRRDGTGIAERNRRGSRRRCARLATSAVAHDGSAADPTPWSVTTTRSWLGLSVGEQADLVST
jgi:hypothetical protein